MVYNAFMRRRLIHFVPVFFCIFSALARVEGGSVHFQRLNADHGLVNNVVLDVFQDRDGFIWLGTLSGISRYDGHRFDNYSEGDPVGNSLASPMVFSLFESAGGRLIAGCGFGGLCEYDREKGVFRQLTIGRKDEIAIKKSTVLDVFEAKTGVFWLATHGAGLFRWAPESDTVDEITVSGESENLQELKNLRCFLHRDGDVVWLGTYGGGLLSLNTKTGQLTRMKIKGRGNAPPPDAFTCMVSVSDQEIWAGTREGLYRVLSDSESASCSAELIHEGYVRCLLKDRDSVVWVGVDSALLRYLPGSPNPIVYRHNQEEPGSLSSDQVRCLFEDKSGVVWIGTSLGLNLFSPYRNRFSLSNEESLADQPRVAGNHADDISLSLHGYQWGKDERGLYRMASVGAGKEYFHPDPKGHRSLRSTNLADYVIDGSERLWLAGEHGLDRWCEESHDFVQFLPSPKERSRFRFKSVLSLHLDRTKRLWAGTYGGGIFRFSDEEKGFEPVILPGGKTQVVLDMVDDVQGRMAFLTPDQLILFDEKTQWIRRFYREDGFVNPLMKNTSLFSYEDGFLGCRLQNGTFRFHPDRIPVNRYAPVPVLSKLMLSGRTVAPKTTQEGPALDFRYGEGPLMLRISTPDYHIPARTVYFYRLSSTQSEWQRISGQPELMFVHLSPGRHILSCRAENHDGIMSGENNVLTINVLPRFWQQTWFLGLIVIFLLLLGLGIHMAYQAFRLWRMDKQQRFETLCDRYGLSEREKEILTLVLQGKGNKDIEEALFISISTVKNHVHNILQKCSARSRAELIHKFESRWQ